MRSGANAYITVASMLSPNTTFESFPLAVLAEMMATYNMPSRNVKTTDQKLGKMALLCFALYWVTTGEEIDADDFEYRGKPLSKTPVEIISKMCRTVLDSDIVLIEDVTDLMMCLLAYTSDGAIAGYIHDNNVSVELAISRSDV